MNNDRLMGFMWGILGGGSIAAAVFIHPLLILGLPAAFGLNYSFSRG